LETAIGALIAGNANSAAPAKAATSSLKPKLLSFRTIVTLPGLDVVVLDQCEVYEMRPLPVEADVVPKIDPFPEYVTDLGCPQAVAEGLGYGGAPGGPPAPVIRRTARARVRRGI
jgi:hypothetical protein